MSEEEFQQKSSVLPGNMDLKLKDLYYNPKSPASFSSMQRLYKEAKKTFPTITRSQVQSFLNSQRTYTLYRQSIERYKRLKTIPSGLHSDWQADLMDVQKHSKVNKGHNYILVCIDVLSRMVYAKGIKRKTSENVIQAFKEIFKEAKVVPRRLFTDNGKEFTSDALYKFYESEEIIKLNAMTHDILHATMAERTIKTLRDKFAKYFSENGTYKWTDALEDIIYGINHRIQSTTKMRPVDVTYENAEALRSKLYNFDVNLKKPRFKVGDLVRISARKVLFKKSQIRFTNEIFRIVKMIRRTPIVYNLEDLKGEKILGYFYEQDLVAVINQV